MTNSTSTTETISNHDSVGRVPFKYIDTLLDDRDIDAFYDPFSREPEYINANRDFVANLPLSKHTRIVDLACGTSTMTRLILERLYGEGRLQTQNISLADGVQNILAIDLSRESLKLGWQYLVDLGYIVPNMTTEDKSENNSNINVVQLIEGAVDCLPFAGKCADFAIMGNAIQFVDDLDNLFAELNRVLRPGGRFAFNTLFYAGTCVPGTEDVYRRWAQEAIDYISEIDSELRSAGQPGVARKRGKACSEFSEPWLSFDDYTAKMRKHGFRVEVSYQRTVMLNQRCFETLGASAGIAKVLLSGYPIKLACEALEKTAARTLKAMDMKQVPRYWLEVVAGKTRS